MNIFPRVVKFFSASTIRTVTVLYGTLLFALMFNLVILSQEKVGTNTSRVADLSLPECVIDTTKNTVLQNSCMLTKDLNFNTPNITLDGNEKTIDGNGKYRVQIFQSNTVIKNVTITNTNTGRYLALSVQEPARDVLLQKITISQASYGIGFDDNTTGTITQSTIKDVLYNGIDNIDFTNVSILHNTIQRANVCGVQLSDSSTGKVSNNLIEGSKSQGICLTEEARINNIDSFPDGNSFSDNTLGNCVGNGFTDADKHGGKCPDGTNPEVCQRCGELPPYPVSSNPVTYAYYHAYGNNQCCAGLSGGELCYNASLKSCPGSTASTPAPTQPPAPIPTRSTPWPPEDCSRLTELRANRETLYMPPDAKTKFCPTDYPICNTWQINSSGGYGGGCVKAYTLPANEYCGLNAKSGVVQDMVCHSNKCNYAPLKSRDKDNGIYTIAASGTCAYEIKKINEECVPNTDYQRCEDWPNTWCSNSGPLYPKFTCQLKNTTSPDPATLTPTRRPTVTPAPYPNGHSCTRPSDCISKNCKKVGTSRSGTCQAAATPTTGATISIRPPDTTATPPTGNPPGGATGAPTGNQQETVAIVLDLKLPGVGTSAPNNTNPHRPTRLATVYLFDAKNDLAKTIKGDASYNGTTGSYLGTIAIPNLPAGQYRVESKFDNTLQTKIPGIVTTTQQSTTLPAVTLISGDIDQNNILDLRDYSAFISCFGAKSCAGNLKVLSDFNADGLVNEQDLNILLRSFAIQQGD